MFMKKLSYNQFTDFVDRIRFYADYINPRLQVTDVEFWVGRADHLFDNCSSSGVVYSYGCTFNIFGGNVDDYKIGGWIRINW